MSQEEEDLRDDRDEKVLAMGRLVESRPITRDDLPPWRDMNDLYWGEMDSSKVSVSPMADVLDAVVEHINSHGGLGIDTREPLEQAIRERDDLDEQVLAMGRLMAQAQDQRDMREMSREHEALRDERDDWREQAHSNAVERDNAVTERDDAIAWGKDWRRRAIEAEQATPDPVEKLARELAAAAGADFDEQEDTGADMLTKIAAHVIEREAKQ